MDFGCFDCYYQDGNFVYISLELFEFMLDGKWANNNWYARMLQMFGWNKRDHRTSRSIDSIVGNVRWNARTDARCIQPKHIVGHEFWCFFEYHRAWCSPIALQHQTRQWSQAMYFCWRGVGIACKWRDHPVEKWTFLCFSRQTQKDWTAWKSSLCTSWYCNVCMRVQLFECAMDCRFLLLWDTGRWWIGCNPFQYTVVRSLLFSQVVVELIARFAFYKFCVRLNQQRKSSSGWSQNMHRWSCLIALQMADNPNKRTLKFETKNRSHMCSRS